MAGITEFLDSLLKPQEEHVPITSFLDSLLKTPVENELKAPPRNPLVAPQADLAKKVKEYLNRYETKKLGKIDSPWNRFGAGHSIGDLLLGQSPELLDDISYGLNPLTSGGHTGRIPIPDKRLLDAPLPIPGSGGVGVIKNKGGNWLTGSVEKALSRLKKRPEGLYVGENLNVRITPEGRLYEITDGNGTFARSYLNEDGAIDPSFELDPEESAINSWIDTTLTKYVKNRMATPEDEVRKLADEGILHIDVARDILDDNLINKRWNSGFPIEGLAKSDLGHAWEDIPDSLIFNDTAGQRRIASGGDFDRGFPEFAKVPDKTPIYQITGNANHGFDHMIDELNNMLDPNSGLPMNLRLTPEGLKGLSMEEAVKKVHQTNQFRAKQAEIARKRIAKAEGIPVQKEYEDGWRWLAPDDVTKDSKAKEYVKNAGNRSAWCTQGDGTCEHYAGGDSRVMILADPEGNPHVQVGIEYELPKYNDFTLDEWEALTNTVKDHAGGLFGSKFVNADDFDSVYYYAKANDLFPKDKIKQKIAQLKPIGNSWDSKKVKELMEKDPEYKKKVQSMMQDFVKSGNWADVGDLQNANLVDIGKELVDRDELLNQILSDERLLRELGSSKSTDPDQLINRYRNYKLIGTPGI